jgi:hypothetical protein
MTVFGPVQVRRTQVGARTGTSLFPLDAGLNLPPEEHSHGVRLRVATQAAKGSYDEAVREVQSTTGARVSKRQTEKLAVAAAQDFDEFYRERPAEEVRARPGEIVVLTTDAKGIVVRREDLREDTRRKAEGARHKLDKRLSPGEKRNRKRMATVCAVYSVAPFVRTPEDIVRELRPVRDEAAPKRPAPQHKRVWAGVRKEPGELVGELYAEGERRDPEHRQQWAALVDGNRTQIDQVLEEAARRKVAVTLVLDIIHVLEYLWQAAWCFHAAGSPDAQKWVTERLLQILRGKATDVAAGIRRSATLRALPAGARKGADRCADYFLAKSRYMRYDEYLAQGLPIATGIIEGACRHLVKDRMDLTGARWSLDGADAVLRLRALRSSGDFDAYWSFHLEHELRRNHLCHYADGCVRLPSTRPALRLVGAPPAVGLA